MERCTLKAMELDYFGLAGPMTELTELQASMVRNYSAEASELGHAVQQLLISPGDSFGTGLSERQLAERNTRPAADLLRRALELDSVGLGESREAKNRVVGSCRHYAVLTTAMLPWDEWGSMTASYNGETGSEFDRLMDEAAKACASGNRSSIDQVYFQLSVPGELIN